LSQLIDVKRYYPIVGPDRNNVLLLLCRHWRKFVKNIGCKSKYWGGQMVKN